VKIGHRGGIGEGWIARPDPDQPVALDHRIAPHAGGWIDRLLRRHMGAAPNGTEHRAIVDTHRHPIGPKLAAKMAERGLYDPKQEFPQTNAQDLIGYREFYDLEYAMPKQREEGVTLSLASNGGEVEWFARDLLKVSTGDALKFLNDEYLEIRDRYPGEFALMANAHALEEDCRPIVEEMIRQGGAKAIAVASSYGDGADRAFLDSPKAEWLWEFAEANDIVVHIHPPMLSVGHEVLMQYRLNEAVGRPFDSTVNGARMIASGLFDRHPKLQVLIVHMGGELASVLGRLEFNWRLNYNGDPQPAGRQALQEQAAAIRLLQDQHPGRLHGVQPNRTASRG
jgi:predicted TIM-barrel fold metal-dependent hydrolase